MRVLTGAVLLVGVGMVIGRTMPAAQTVAAGANPACALVTKAEVEQLLGRRMFTDPEAMSLMGGAGSLCAFDEAQVMLFSGARSEAQWNELVKRFGNGQEPRVPVTGLGDRAYAFHPAPRNKYQDTSAFVVAFKGPHTVAVSVNAESDKPASSAQPQAEALAKLVLSRLK